MAGAKKGKGSSQLASNRKARHEYHLLERFEAGIVLTGPEVKSVRQGGLSLKEAYGKIAGGEVFLVNAHISPYSHGNRENPDPRRTRKLLLHAREIRKLARATENTGMTIVPLAAFLSHGYVKIEIAVARGKKLHDKRDSKRRQEMQREIDRESGRRD